MQNNISKKRKLNSNTNFCNVLIVFYLGQYVTILKLTNLLNLFYNRK